MEDSTFIELANHIVFVHLHLIYQFIIQPEYLHVAFLSNLIFDFVLELVSVLGELLLAP